jgi:hypothetical protein
MSVKTILLAVLTIFLVTSVAQAQSLEQPEEPEAGRRVALVAVGEVDAAVVERIKKWVEHNTALPVHIYPAREAEADTLHDEGMLAAAAMGAQDVCLVALVVSKTVEQAHSVNIYDKNVGVVNVRALTPTPEDTEKLARRLELLTVRGYGFLLGAKPVPIPESALYPYKNLEELDAMGRGIDPPTLKKVQDSAAAKGVKLIEDSPFYIK